MNMTQEKSTVRIAVAMMRRELEVDDYRKPISAQSVRVYLSAFDLAISEIDASEVAKIVNGD